jgi:nucleoside-diphosphate-sugar epimerase
MAYIDDIVSANIFAMNYPQNFNGQHFDVGTGENISLNEIKEIVLKYHSHVKFDYIEPRKGDVLHTKANINDLTVLGWTPQISILGGIHKCFGEIK